MPERRDVALITGASRGIGRAIALRLARDGFDVALLARTAVEGEARDHSSTLRERDESPLPGSLTTTAAEVEGLGARALALPADLLERGSVERAASTVLEQWGAVSLLVNNGRYVGPGHMDRIVDTPIELLDRHIEANVIAPLILIKALLPGMLARGGGTIVNVTTLAAFGDPALPAGEGGWGLGYGLSKAALHRVAGTLHTELASEGIRAFNLQPGVVATERIAHDMERFGFENVGAPPEVVATIVGWLVREAAADELAGTTVDAQPLCHELGLVPGWEGPRPNATPIRFDRAAAAAECAAS